MRVAIIDYGVGNLGSVARSLEELKVKPVLVDRAVDLHLSDSLILPGVGNFAECAKILESGGWYNAILEEVNEKKKTNSWYMLRYAIISIIWFGRFFKPR